MLGHAPDCHPGRCADDCAVTLVDAAAEQSRSPSRTPRQASRLFYCPKASRRERDAGCGALPPRALDLFPNAKNGRRPPPTTNPHPRVKPLALMRWLVRLVAPNAGLALDPFCGSGTTGCAAVLERRLLARITHWAASRAADERASHTAETA